MPLVHGQHISAGEVERTVSSWDAERFARLCNSIAWATTWARVQALPAFTERVLVADRGIDAEWTGVMAPGVTLSGSFFRSGTNVFQYKKREVVERTRSEIASKLARDLDGAIAEVERRTKKTLVCYVLFTNVDLVPAQHEQIKQSIQKGLGARQIAVQVVGAADLAAMLNALPHVRSAFFATLAFQAWGLSWEAHRRGAVFAETSLVGRDSTVGALTALLDDPEVRVIALTGTHMMGKSRIALEATRSWDVAFVEALDRHGPSLSDLMQLTSPGRTVVALLNDPDRDTARDLAQVVIARDGLKLLLCLSTEDSTPRPSFGFDNRVRQLAIPPLSDDGSRELLKAAGAKLDFSLESWVIGNAGGVPGVLLAAAHFGPRLREDGGTFLEQIAGEFENELHARLSVPEMQAIRAIALLSHLGVRGQASSETTTLCAHFALDANNVLNAIDRLAASGFVRTEGSYAEVVPPPLANRLAGRFLRGRSVELAACFTVFDEAARRRLLRRLVQITGDEALSFWSDLFGGDGPFSSLNAIAENSELFQFAATANGQQAGALLLRELKAHSVEERRRLEGDTRRNLVHAIEEMLFRESTGETAIWCMALLAEAENETWGNNASGILKEVFGPLHPQMPLRLDRRLAALTEMITPNSSCALSVLAADAIGDLLDFSSSTALRHSPSAVPLGRTPNMMWSDVWEYAAKTLQLLAEASKDSRDRVRKRACSRLPRTAANLLTRQHPAGMAVLQQMVTRVVAGDYGIDASNLGESIRWCRYALRDDAHGGSEANTVAVDQLTELHDRLLNADFGTRIRFWLGGWYRDIEAQDDPRDAGEQAIPALAEEATKNPELLDANSIRWLSREAERGPSFWHELGRLDSAGAFHAVVGRLAEDAKSAYSFAAYLAGWSTSDAKAAAQFLDAQTRRDEVASQSVLYGTLRADSPDVAADRIFQLVQSDRVERLYVVGAINASPWLRDVSEEKLAQVLEVIAAPNLENSSRLLQILDFRSDLVPWHVGPLAELVWRCLEAHPVIGHQDDYYFDHVASRLARNDPDRAFGVLARCLDDTRSSHRWNPVSSGLPQHAFWNTLSELDRPRLLSMVLETARLPTTNGYSVIFHLPNLIDMTADAAALLNYASRSEDHGITVCRAIVGGQPAFWPLAFRLVELYPHSRVEGELTLRIEQMGQVISGPYSDHYRRCIEEIEAAMKRPHIPARALSWLDRVAVRFRTALQDQLRREADERVDRG